VCHLSGKPFSSFGEKAPSDLPIARIVLERSRPVLIEKINQRVDEMFERGVVAEVAAVEAIGPTASKAIGFQLIRSLLAGTIDMSHCRDAMKQQTQNYAKRQMTWFRRSPYESLPADSSVDFVVATCRERLSRLGSQLGN
jgi:tRNA dimethylallyltransferase